MSFWQWINRNGGIFAPMCGVGSAVLVLWRFFSGGLPGLFSLGTLLGVLAIIAFGIGLPNLAIFRELALAGKALENCDPEPLLDWSVLMLHLHNAQTENSRRARFTALTNQMTALHALGRLCEAEESSRRMDAGISVALPEVRCIVLLNLSSLRLEQNRMEEAAAYLQQVEELLTLHPPKKPSPARDFALESNRISCRLDAMDPLEALALTLDLAERYHQGSLRAQVVSQFSVALRLLALDRGEEALPYLRFVAERGGKLGYCRQARDLLRAGLPTGGDPVGA